MEDNTVRNAQRNIANREEHLRALLSRDEEYWGKDHPAILENLNALARVLSTRGNINEAEVLLRRALDILERFGQDFRPHLCQVDNRTRLDHDQVESLNNLGNLLRYKGEFGEAEKNLLRALEIRENFPYLKNYADIAWSYNNLGNLYWDLGDNVKAESHHRKALHIREIALGPDHQDTVVSLNNLGFLLQKTGRASEAEPLLRRALGARRRSQGLMHPDTANSTNIYGLLLWDMGRPEKAERLLRQALDIRCQTLGPGHPDLVESLNDLGVLLESRGRLDEAERRFAKAVDICERSLGAEHPDTAVSKRNLALTYAAQQGHSFFSLEKMREASAIEDRMIGQVCSVSSDKHRMDYLESKYESLWQMVSLVVDCLPHSDYAVRSAMDMVLHRKALAFEAQTIQRDAVYTGRNGALKLKLEKLRSIQQQATRMALESPERYSPVDEREGDAQKRRDEIWARRQWLESERDGLEAEIAREIPEMNLEIRLRIADRASIAQSLKQSASKNAALIEFIKYQAYDFRAVPARREEKWKSAKYAAFVLLANAPDDVKMVDLGEADRIDAMISAFRAHITGGGDEARGDRVANAGSSGDIRSEGERLRKAVFDGLAEHLGNAERLFIAPDGQLSLLPFEVLPVGEDRFLIDEYCISYLGCGRDALRFGAKLGHEREATPPLVIADPDFDLDAPGVPDDPNTVHRAHATGRVSRGLDLEDFHRLPESKEEGKEIARMLRVEALLDKHALEDSVKSLPSPRIMHIATHGFFAEDQMVNPGASAASHTDRTTDEGLLGWLSAAARESPLLRSGLALAGANKYRSRLKMGAEDGLLTAEDVTGLDLLGTDLVVLSACVSGLGTVKTGEGVFGLRRSFAIAGAKTLIVSLWTVNDEITRELMKKLYENLKSGMDCSAALRDAQRYVRQRYTDNSSPYLWGAFICQGEGGKVFAPRTEPVDA